jgi:hypothetical protein
MTAFPCDRAGTRCPESVAVIDKQPYLLTFKRDVVVVGRG